MGCNWESRTSDRSTPSFCTSNISVAITHFLVVEFSGPSATIPVFVNMFLISLRLIVLSLFAD